MSDFNIMTFHTAFNHGAVLQTLGLQVFLGQLGFSAAVYDYRPPFNPRPAGLRNKVMWYLRKLHNGDYAEKERRFQAFAARNLQLTKEKDCRVFLAGSDQIWNPTGEMNPMFFLQYAPWDCLHASYAASMGNTKIPPLHRDTFARYIRSFDVISVREQEVKDVIAPLYSGSIEVNVDPTLLHDANFWRQYEEPVEGLPKAFTLVYVLHLAKNVNCLLRWLKKETNEPLVLIDGQGLMTVFVQHDIAVHNAGPAQFLWLVDHASRVVTTSFHGTVFSVVFQKELYSILNPAAPSRISNLLSLVGLEPVQESRRTFTRPAPVNWSEVQEILAGERKKSEAYLRRVYELAMDLKRPPIEGTVEDMSVGCTGCSACAAACPVKAIRMELNAEGFLAPVVNQSRCIHCGKCRQTCPQEKLLGRDRVAAWYGWHRDPKVLFGSSSGGIMRALADPVLKDGGLVFGAAFSEDWRSVFLTDTDHVSLEALQKSKYTVSDPGDSYPSAKQALEAGRRVLFCGTPCQCAGLRAFLGREYDNLLTCDFVCGGMSSLAFYREHLDLLEQRFGSKIAQVDFRPKDKGWGKQRLKVRFKNGEEYLVRSHLDTYFKSFANTHVSVRDTCLRCKYTGFHAADLTLADFWGYKSLGLKVQEGGLSLVAANSEKGKQALEQAEHLELTSLDMKYSDYAFRVRGPELKKLEERKRFFEKALELGSFEEAFLADYDVSEAGHIKSYVKLKLHLK